MSDNTRDYRDENDFHDVEDGPAFQEWTKGMDQFRPEHTDALDGQLDLHRADGAVLKLTLSGSKADWSITTAPTDRGQPDWFAHDGAGSLRVMALANDIYYVDILTAADRPEQATCTTIVYDRPRSRALVVHTWTYDRGDARRTKSAIDPVGVGGPTSMPIERTSELVGRRAMWVYSEQHAYEHIYLNYGTYAWHCLAGPERSIADVDRTETYKIADEVYLFFVTETVFPWDGAFVLDFTPGTCTNIGRFFGWDPKPDTLSHQTFGAKGRILNETDYSFTV